MQSTNDAHLRYVLRLADSALILGQRNAEWTGHGPVLEEDIALSNLSLDLIGQARLLYTHAGRLEGKLTGMPRSRTTTPTGATSPPSAITRCWNCRTPARCAARLPAAATMPSPSCATSSMPR